MQRKIKSGTGWLGDKQRSDEISEPSTISIRMKIIVLMDFRFKP